MNTAPAAAPERPMPTPTRESQSYWDGLREGKLMLQHCASCGKIRHYPRPVCPHCFSMDSEFKPAPLSGTLHTWTVCHHPFNFFFKAQAPFIVALVDMDAGVRINAPLRGVAESDLKIGQKVPIALLAAAAAVLISFAASAQTDWPTKPVNMVVPYPPGGLNDAVARVYADKLTALLGKTVLVDNRAGAATTVASNSVAKAAPDGYTIYAGGTSLIINPTLTGNVQYDPHKSFDLVSLMSFTPFILQVNSEFPAKTMAELIAVLKANPGKYNMASSGVGATNHMAAELFRARTGLKYTIVPYRGGAQAAQDLAGGSAQMMFSASLEAKPLLDSKKTRAIAISSQTRSLAFPDIPTVAEVTDMKDFLAIFWQGMVLPAGTPKPIAAKLQAAIAKVAADPEVIERFKVQGVEIKSSTPEEFKDFYLKEEKVWTTLIKEQGIKSE